MSHRFVAIIFVVVAAPTTLSLFFNRFGDQAPIRTAAALPLACRAKLILSFRANLAPRNGMREDVLLDSRSRNPVVADDTRGRGKRTMALEDSFEPNTTLDIIDILSVIAKKLRERRCQIIKRKELRHYPYLATVFKQFYETMTRRRYKVARVYLAVMLSIAKTLQPLDATHLAKELTMRTVMVQVNGTEQSE